MLIIGIPFRFSEEKERLILVDCTTRIDGDIRCAIDFRNESIVVGFAKNVEINVVVRKAPAYIIDTDAAVVRFPVCIRTKRFDEILR